MSYSSPRKFSLAYISIGLGGTFTSLVFLQWDLDMWVSLVSYKSDMDRAGWGRRDGVGGG